MKNKFSNVYVGKHCFPIEGVIVFKYNGELLASLSGTVHFLELTGSVQS